MVLPKTIEKHFHVPMEENVFRYWRIMKICELNVLGDVASLFASETMYLKRIFVSYTQVLLHV